MNKNISIIIYNRKLYNIKFNLTNKKKCNKEYLKNLSTDNQKKNSNNLHISFF